MNKTLSLGGKLSAKTQSKLKELATKPKESTIEAHKVNNANVKNDSKSAKAENPSPRSEQQDKKHKAIELRKKQIEQAKSLYKQHFTHFSKLYPKCFSQTPKPLAVGINKVMLEEEAKNQKKSG